jgi:hypothetical protein
MILDNITKAAFKLINSVAPSLNPQRFLDGLKVDFNPNLSDEENFQRMMGGIKEDEYGFGPDLAEAASYETKTNKSFEEELEEHPDAKATLGGGSKDKKDKKQSGDTQHQSN